MATENKKTCPNCKKSIAESAETCPKCNTQLIKKRWEVRLPDGEVWETETAGEVAAALLEGRISLDSETRHTVLELSGGVDGHRFQPTEKSEDWEPLQIVGRKEFAIRRLYEPVRTFAFHGGIILAGIAFLIGAVGWMADLLLMEGGSIGGSILWSVLLFVTMPTVIGLAVVGIIVHTMYRIQYLAIGFRLIVALAVGVGFAAVGFGMGYVLGAIVGLIVGKKVQFDGG